MDIQAIRTSSLTVQDGNQFQKYKTLEVRGNIKDAPIEISFKGQRYFKQEIEKNGKKEYKYVCADEDPKKLTAEEAKRYTTQRNKKKGKLSFLEGLSEAWNAIKDPFIEIVKSPKKLAIAAACCVGVVAACCIPVVGPYIAAGLVYGGLALGTGTLAVGTVQVATAENREESVNGWRNIGSGGFTTITSLIGLRGLKASLATKATAIEQATEKTAGTIDKITKIAAPPIPPADSVDDCIQVASGLSKAFTSIKNATGGVVKGVKTVTSAPFKPVTELGSMGKTFKTISAINKATEGLGKAKFNSFATGISTGVKESDDLLAAFETQIGDIEKALKASKFGDAYIGLKKAEALIPHLSGDTTKASIALSNLETTLSACSAAAKPGLKATVSTMAGIEVGKENLTATPEDEKLTAYEIIL